MQDWNTVRPRGSGLQLRWIFAVVAVIWLAAVGAMCVQTLVFG